MDFERLRQKRLNWVKANRENGFDEGINRLLTELYPDNAHFIYELLQNAEDPKSTKVSFTLTDREVRFEHNGEKLFSIEDIESITSIGNSTKRDDPTSIGKFGVGFKAVFAYTNTPRIHSGEFNFSIHDLVVPEHIPPIAGQDSKKTTFIFPFNNPKKSPVTAKNEIEKGLRNLGDNTLLFLSHISKIDYVLPDGSRGYLKRINHENGRIEIRTLHPGGMETISNWLHFQTKVEVKDENNQPKIFTFAIAYSLIKDNDNKTEKELWKIEPLNQGQVSIYFPAEKETSKLRFHIHAPFASTVARDSIRDCPENLILRDIVSLLVVKSLSSIREQGLLNVSFMAVLPNPSDNLSSFYEPIRESVVDAFKSENLVPMKQGGHASANGVFKGPAEISNVIDDQDLILLLGDGYEGQMWVANPPQKNQREDKFLESLDIEEWGMDELLNSLSSNWDRNRIENWLNAKDDSWMMKFYALLAGIPQYKLYRLRSIRLIRVSTKVGDKNVIAEDAFFPPEDAEIETSDDVFFVKPQSYAIGRSDYQKQNAKLFLNSVGVRVFDTNAIVLRRLKIYNDDFPDDHNENIKDIKLFISYWKKNTDRTSIFKNSNFNFIMTLVDGEILWANPDLLYLDEPYVETGLNQLKDIHMKYEVWPGYIDKLSKTQLKDFINFLKAIGVMHELEISSASIRSNKNYYEFRRSCIYAGESEYRIAKDYDIENLEDYIKLNSEKAAILIWHALIKASPEVSKAKYRANKKTHISEADSQLIDRLKNAAWIPNKDGVFCKPQDISPDDLPREFLCDDRNGLLTAIGFGENAKKKSEEYQAKNKAAIEIGFKSAEDAAKWAEVDALGISPDELIAKRKKPELPEESVSNAKRRSKSVLERSVNSPTRQSVIKERSIQVGKEDVTSEAKVYLRNKYTNSNHEMVCQCCQQVMPFKIGDEFYFEAVQCIKETKTHYKENRLALCPTCAAMYQHARETDDLALKSLITDDYSDDDASSVAINVHLAGSERMLRFVGTHWFDLREILISLE